MRHYTRKSTRGQFTRGRIEEALEEVSNGISIRSAARTHGLNYRTLTRYMKMKRTTGNLDGGSFGYIKVRKVLSNTMEQDIVDYLVHAAGIFHGLTNIDLRVLAYDLTVANNVVVPSSWTRDKRAGEDWAKDFMKRHENLISLRSPEPTSIQRMTNFNEYNVTSFFDNLRVALDRGKYGPESIWNVDETGVSTVQRPSKVVAGKGTKQVGSVVSQERGTLVTLCCAANAIGNMIPPFFVFPRVNVQQHWLIQAPPQSGMAGHPQASGWMTKENFVEFLKHFVKFAKPCQQQPVLLILDNHSSHVNLEVINYCRDNSIVLLSFPPHCSHELQPLDKSVYGPLKTYYNQACDSWMREPQNAGHSMTIHVIPSMVSIAFPRAFTPTNITAGFRATGIYPFDRNIFPPEKFLPSTVTDRPLLHDSDNQIPTVADTEQEKASDDHQTVISGDQIPSTSGMVLTLNMTVSPEVVRPFSRKAPRKDLIQKRKKAKSQILTDTPVKAVLEEEVRAKANKTRARKKIVVAASSDSSSESDADEAKLCDDSTDCASDDDRNEGLVKHPTTRQLSSDDHVLVRFPCGKNGYKYFVGRIVKVNRMAQTVDTLFMRRVHNSKMGSFVFIFPEDDDKCTTGVGDVVLKLPFPCRGATKRSSQQFTFSTTALADYVLE